jgi:hypothetical protein
MAREKDKLDPMWPQLEKKEITIAQLELAEIITSLEDNFLNGLVIKN